MDYQNFPKLIGIDLPIGYPEPVPVQQTWCLDSFVEEIMDYPIRSFAGEPKILFTYGENTSEEGQTFFSTPESVANLLHLRQPEGHKGTFGRLLIIGGSENYPGAVFLAAASALRSGCGLVTIATEVSLPWRDPQITYLPLPHQKEKEAIEAYLQNSIP